MTISWTYSRLDTFTTCGRKFYHTHVLKDVVEPPTVHTEWGTRVHSALEDAVRDGTPLPEGMTQWQKLADKFREAKGDKFLEYRFAIDRNLQPCDWKQAWSRGIADGVAINGDKALTWDYKGFPLDQEVPTPTGFTTMANLAVGDNVFSRTGEICQVIGKSGVHNKPCMRITFDDTSTVVCDEDHLWLTFDGVVAAKELKTRADMPLCEMVQYPPADLPIDPYVFGLWIADGKHTSAEITKPDDFVWEEIKRRGYEIGHDYSERANDGKCRVHTVKGIRGQLTRLGVIGDKRIPDLYLLSSISQRIDLLRGLMDGDGSVNKIREQVVYSTVNRSLAESVKQLVASLGQRPLISQVTAHGFGKTVTAYPISWKPQGFNPFMLPRKADLVLPTWGRGKSWKRKVTKVESVPTVPTQCIEVNSVDKTYLVGRNYMVTHNTGKRKVTDQLSLYAAYIFAHYEEVQTVTTSFVWLKENKLDNDVYKREDVGAIWQKLMPRIVRLEKAYEKDKWEPKPSGLCSGWCPVGKDKCEFWKPRRT